MTTETRTTHTPGPWRITGSGINGEMVIGDHGRTVAIWPYLGFNPPESVEAMANARLIAAAPELLAALEALIDTAESAHYKCNLDDAGDCRAEEYGDGTADEHADLLAATAAIAKARGQ